MPTKNTTPNTGAMSTATIPVVIPGNIASCTDLSWTEKGVFGLIYALSRKNGVCTATNDFIAERLGLGVRYVPEIVQKLVQKNLIVFLNQNQKSRQRRLGVVDTYHVMDDTVNTVSKAPPHTAVAAAPYSNNRKSHTLGAVSDHTVTAVTSTNLKSEADSISLSADAAVPHTAEASSASPSHTGLRSGEDTPLECPQVTDEIEPLWMEKALSFFRCNGVSSPRPNAVRRQALVFRAKGVL